MDCRLVTVRIPRPLLGSSRPCGAAPGRRLASSRPGMGPYARTRSEISNA
jgi:hypothetical protein